MLTVTSSETTLFQKNIHKRYKRFTEYREDDDEPPGLPTTSTSKENNETVKKWFQN